MKLFFLAKNILDLAKSGAGMQTATGLSERSVPRGGRGRAECETSSVSWGIHGPWRQELIKDK